MIDLTEFFTPTTNIDSVRSRAISAIVEGKSVILGEEENKIVLAKADEVWFVVKTSNSKVFTKSEDNAVNVFISSYLFGVAKGSITINNEPQKNNND